MRQSCLPIFDGASPSLGNIVHRQIHQLQHRFLIGKHSLGLNHLAQKAVEGLDGIGGVDAD